MAGVEVAAVAADGPQAEHCHAERATRDGERVGEVQEGPDHQPGRCDEGVVPEGELTTPHRRDEELEHLAGQRVEDNDGEGVDEERGQAGDDAGVVTLEADVALGGGLGAHDATGTSAPTSNGGPAGIGLPRRPNSAIDHPVHEPVHAHPDAANGVDGLRRHARTGVGDQRAELGALDEPVDVDPLDDRVHVDLVEHLVEVDLGDDRVDVDLVDHLVEVEPRHQRVHVDLGQDHVDHADEHVRVEPDHDACQVDAVEQRVEIDALQQLVEVDPVEHGLEVDPIQDRLHVDPIEDGLHVDPLHHLVDVERGDDAGSDLVGDRLHDGAGVVDERGDHASTRWWGLPDRVPAPNHRRPATRARQLNGCRARQPGRPGRRPPRTGRRPRRGTRRASGHR